MSTVIEQLRAAGVQCQTRAQWGSPREADGSYARRRSSHPMPAGPAHCHFLHITVTADTDTVQAGAAGMRQIETYGYSTPPMVSYQDCVTNEGRYFEGQSYGVKGTHTVNDKNLPGFPEDLNLYGYATALLQNVDDAVTDEQVRTVAMVYAARELAGLVVRGAPVYPHRMFAYKACPGDRAVARLQEIIDLKNQYVRQGLPGGLDEGDDDMPLSDDDVDRIAKATAKQLLDSTLPVKMSNGRKKKITIRQALRQAANAPTVVREAFDKIADQLPDDDSAD